MKLKQALFYCSLCTAAMLQVRSYCDSIANFTGQSLTKLYLVKGLQDDKKLPC